MQAECLSPGMRLLAWGTLGVVWATIAALVALFAALMIWPEALALAVRDLPEGDRTDLLQGAVRASLLALAGLSLLPPLWGLLQIVGLFRGFLAGAIFTARTARHLHRIGLAAVLAALIGMGVRTGAGVILSMAAREWQGGAVSITIGSGGVATMIFGGLLIVLGAVFADAAKLADDNRQIV